MLIVDRLEDDVAVIETDTVSLTLPRSSLPSDVREGDILAETVQGYVVLEEETHRRREELVARTRRIIKK